MNQQPNNNFLNGILGGAPPSILIRNNVEFPQSTAPLNLFKPMMQQPVLNQQQPNRIIQRPAPIVAQKAIPRVPPSEMCPIYNQPLVAYDEKQKQFYCNQTIFEKKIQGLKFTAIVVKELKARFAKEYERYRESMNQMEQANPDFVKQ